MTRPIESDDFAMSIETILANVGHGVREVTPEVVRAGARSAAKHWRTNIKDNFRDGQTYRKHGRTYRIGRYRRSVRSHVISRSMDHPAAEAGVPSMPGLAHPLEDGHAKVGGGRVRAIPHVRDAAEAAFEETERMAIEAIERVLHDA